MEKTADINAQLIEKCLEGDIRAQFQLYKQYSRAMYNVAIRILDNKMDAEDVLQESFVKAFKNIRDLHDPLAFGSWLKRIVINRCISLQRKRKLYFEDLPEEQTNTDPPEDGFMLGDEDSDHPDPTLIHQAIRRLPAGARTILNLHALEGLKHREIAAMLEISESTSKSQYHRALKLLRQELIEHEHET